MSSLRWRLILGTVLLTVAAAIAATTAALGGAAPERSAVPVSSADSAAPAANVDDAITAVQGAFNDGLIQSASIDGPTVTVNLASPGNAGSSTTGAASAIEAFEAAVLAHAVADWQLTHGQTAVTEFSPVQPNGQPIAGMPTEIIGADSNATPLTAGTCESAAQQTPASLTVTYAATLPFAGGTCVVKVQTTGDPNVAAAAVSTGISNEIATPDDYPYLIEVDDSAGTPEVIFTWVPGAGVGHGQGMQYVRPGLSSAAGG